jgi:hypothetical protein
MAEFEGPTEVVEAARRVHEAGYKKVDAISPQRGGGITGCIAGYALQFWSATIAYPMNIGGRPIHSWPAFIVPTFETTILFAAGTAVLGMLALNGLPEPYHPVFNVPQFARASKDRFFIVIEARDPKFDLDATWSFLTSLEPRSVSEVDQ